MQNAKHTHRVVPNGQQSVGPTDPQGASWRPAGPKLWSLNWDASLAQLEVV